MTSTAPTVPARSRVNVVAEFAVLALEHPGLGAESGVVAAWYGRKAALHERAAAGCAGVERVVELGYAAAAREHAARLSAGPGMLAGGVFRGQEAVGLAGVTPHGL